MAIPKYLAGNTVSMSWVSSGQTATTISVAIISGSETVVSSVAMTSSGNGHYYANVTLPATEGFYVREDLAVIDTKTYKVHKTIKITLQQVD